MFNNPVYKCALVGVYYSPNSLDAEIGGFSLLPVPTIGFIGLILTRKGSYFTVFLQVSYCFCSKGTEYGLVLCLHR
jgi:hypothetical protein